MMFLITKGLNMKQDLINRLNGIYVTKVDDGVGLLNGKDSFTREFLAPPICKEAAAFIEAQEAEINRLREALEVITHTTDKISMIKTAQAALKGE